jgi:hypothetical protein
VLEGEAAVDPELAARKLAGKEFIFDVQGHFIGEAALCPGDPRGPKNFIKDVFLDSDTDMMVLSFVPSRRHSEPLTIQEADAVRWAFRTFQIAPEFQEKYGYPALTPGDATAQQAGSASAMSPRRNVTGCSGSLARYDLIIWVKTAFGCR